jgi:hypothetical protein
MLEDAAGKGRRMRGARPSWPGKDVGDCRIWRDCSTTLDLAGREFQRTTISLSQDAWDGGSGARRWDEARKRRKLAAVLKAARGAAVVRKEYGERAISYIAHLTRETGTGSRHPQPAQVRCLNAARCIVSVSPCQPSLKMWRHMGLYYTVV